MPTQHPNPQPRATGRPTVMSEKERPKVAAEVRAWIGVGAVLIMNTVGGVWWAATLTANLNNLRELVADMKASLGNSYTAAEARRDLSSLQSQLQDHEGRLRALEARKP